ncbi:hypothetical protein LJR090_004428 [Bosea sp. LjRoot90]|uniref:hypothetical protein n=1 Tax=Bosea sp. LjRoot90 TaxID=3342342 RepID=UPI003ECCA268
MAPTILFASTGGAEAHVKWFAPYNVAVSPAALWEVFSIPFVTALSLSILLIAIVFVADRLMAAGGLEDAVDAMFAPLKGMAPGIMRVSLGAFLLCLWLLGGILLTPELKTDSQAVSWFQLFLAICTLWWRTVFIAGFGIVVLYGLAVAQYGAFHLMDYPLFLGIAAYLIIHSLRLAKLQPYALSILYAAMAQTLLWASVEKWAYASWTLPLLAEHERITLGINHHIYVMLAGFVEFVAAFLLLFGMLSQRLVAAMLLGIFIAAVIDFGKVDAVGHLMIIASLGIAVIEGNTAVNRAVQSGIRSYRIGGLEQAATYVGVLLLLFLMYYGAHGLAYGSLA